MRKPVVWTAVALGILIIIAINFVVNHWDREEAKMVHLWLNNYSWMHCLWNFVFLAAVVEELQFRLPILIYFLVILHVNIKALWAAILAVLLSIVLSITSAYLWASEHIYPLAIFFIGMLLNFLIFYEFIYLVPKNVETRMGKLRLLIQPITLTIVTHVLANLFIVFIIKAIIKPVPQ